MVGVAVGLRLDRAVITGLPDSNDATLGQVSWVSGSPKSCARLTEAYGLMLAAGIAWERAHPKGRIYSARDDENALRYYASGKRGIEVYVLAAGALLATLGEAHARVTRALLERDLTGEDIDAISRGEWPEPE